MWMEDQFELLVVDGDEGSAGGRPLASHRECGVGRIDQISDLIDG